MKKFNLSLVAVLAMSTFAIAGGDIAPVEPVIETPMVEESTPGNFYLGLAYSYVNTEVTYAVGSDDDYLNGVMLQAGYKFNPYIAVEGRYTFTAEDTNEIGADYSSDTWGIYAKPMYPVTNELDIYALLGYGEVTPEFNGNAAFDSDTDGFQWGLGASYDVTDSVAIFADYVRNFDDTLDLDGVDLLVDTVSVGVTYNF